MMKSLPAYKLFIILDAMLLLTRLKNDTYKKKVRTSLQG